MSSFYDELPTKNRDRSDRYRNCKLLKDKETGESLLSTREIKDIVEDRTDIFHTVDASEVYRLDLIAYKYYHNTLFWWVIAQANNIRDPFKGIAPGTLLRIPSMVSLYGNNGFLR